MRNVDFLTDSFNLSVPIETTKVVGNDSIAALIRRILADFKAKDVPVNSSSRLCQYASLFDSSLSDVLSDSIHAKLDFAFLEAMQFKTIHRFLDLGADCPLLLRNLATALRGGFDATDDKPDCKARSTQFELYLWAWLRAAGFGATFAEPDLLVQVDHEKKLAVAAKRPRSIKKLVKLLRDGCKQIAKANRHGFVAVDLSFVESLCKPIFVQDGEQHQTLSKIILDGFVFEYQQEICRAVQLPQTIGVLFHYSGVVRSIRRTPMRLVSRRWLFLQTREPPLDQSCIAILEAIQSVGCLARPESL